VTKLAWIALAGALGTLARYGLSGIVQRNLSAGFPWGTFVVNAAGCFLFGAIWALSAERFLINPEIRVIVLTGFMGAFTTFSTFMFESGQLMRDAEWMLVAANVGGQTVVGLIALFAGLAVARVV
jgi:fluoride exporter